MARDTRYEADYSHYWDDEEVRRLTGEDGLPGWPMTIGVMLSLIITMPFWLPLAILVGGASSAWRWLTGRR